MSNQTPLGAIIDRLKNTPKVSQSDVSHEEVLSVVRDLVHRKLVVEVTGSKQGALYYKIPYAMKKLEEASSDEIAER
jgi:hypothetical protein